MIHTLISEALIRLRPGVEFSMNADDTEQIEMLNGMSIPTEEEFIAEVDILLSINIINKKTAQLKAEMYRVLADGFDWRETNPDDWFTISVNEEMQGFLTRTLMKLNEGRVDPHGGFIYSNGSSVAVDDDGIREICIFAGIWGDAISAIRIQELEAVIDWGAFDPFAVDWSVNWSGPDAANGWNNNTVTQAP